MGGVSQSCPSNALRPTFSKAARKHPGTDPGPNGPFILATKFHGSFGGPIRGNFPLLAFSGFLPYPDQRQASKPEPAHFDPIEVDEGYVKYQMDWQRGSAPTGPFLEALIDWRQKLYDWGMIGYYPQLKVGFGNLSVKPAPKQKSFVISGTQTGHLPALSPQHFTTVTEYEIAANRLTCFGPVAASSESLTHAAVYELSPLFQAVIHIHHRPMWDYWFDRLPTSRASVPYGTPAMAQEVKRLYAYAALAQTQAMVMGGHEEGMLFLGTDLDAAGAVLTNWKSAWEQNQ